MFWFTGHLVEASILLILIFIGPIASLQVVFRYLLKPYEKSMPRCLLCLICLMVVSVISQPLLLEKRFSMSEYTIFGRKKGKNIKANGQSNMISLANWPESHVVLPRWCKFAPKVV